MWDNRKLIFNESVVYFLTMASAICTYKIWQTEDTFIWNWNLLFTTGRSENLNLGKKKETETKMYWLLYYGPNILNETGGFF